MVSPHCLRWLRLATLKRIRWAPRSITVTSSTAKGSVLKGILLFLEGRLARLSWTFLSRGCPANSRVCKIRMVFRTVLFRPGGFVGLPPCFGQQSLTVLWGDPENHQGNTWNLNETPWNSKRDKKHVSFHFNGVWKDVRDPPILGPTFALTPR